MAEQPQLSKQELLKFAEEALTTSLTLTYSNETCLFGCGYNCQKHQKISKLWRKSTIFSCIFSI